MWFDSHCHLQIVEENDDLDEVIARAHAARVERMVTVGIDAASNRRVLEIAREAGVYAAVGVHPNSSAGWKEADIESVAELADDSSVVGIGETGLDFYRDHASPDSQIAAFSAHVALAETMGKTLIIHTRDSIDKVLDLLEERASVPRIVFHCWSGDAAHVRRALDLGGYISFAGNVSFKSAENLRTSAKLVPADRLLVETDSPYLAPVPHRGRSNEPAYVADVGAALAAARNESVEVIARHTSANALRAFDIQ